MNPANELLTNERLKHNFRAMVFILGDHSRQRYWHLKTFPDGSHKLSTIHPRRYYALSLKGRRRFYRITRSPLYSYQTKHKLETEELNNQRHASPSSRISGRKSHIGTASASAMKMPQVNDLGQPLLKTLPGANLGEVAKFNAIGEALEIR